MMKKLLFAGIIAFATTAYSQAPVIEWQKSFGGSNDDTLTCVRQTADGGYILTGYTKSANGDVAGGTHGQEDGWVIKLNASGNAQWKKTYGGTLVDYFNEILPTADGYIVIGTSSSNNFDLTANAGGSDIWVLKMDTNGNIQWQKSYGGISNETGASIKTTPDGGYIISGSSNSDSIEGIDVENRGGSDALITKIDATGNIVWAKTFGGNGNDYLRQIVVTDDGGYAFVNLTTTHNNGQVTDSNGSQNIWVVKTDGNGVIQWQRTIGTSISWGYSIIQTNDHGFAIVGDDSGSFSDNHGVEDGVIVKLSEQGVVEWHKSYGGTQSDSAVSIVQTTDGGYVFSGCSKSQDTGDVTGAHGLTDIWLVKTNATGQIQWQKCLGGTASELSYSVMQTLDGGFILTGYARSANGDVTVANGLRDGWVVKLSPEILATNSFESGNLVVYPNPVSDQLNLEFPNLNIETIKINDVTGKTILEQKQNNNSVNTQNLSSGVYFLEAVSANQIYRTKFIKN